ncbi:MAG: hypothetical protein H3Z50_05385 [archaeon]|nr:hypothetical protein [archaeon]
MPTLPEGPSKEEKADFKIENFYWPKDPIKREIRLNLIFSLVESRKKWTDFLDLGLSLPQLEEHMIEMEKAGIVKRKCDTFHLIAPREKIYNTLNLAIKECEKRIDLLKDLLLRLS